MGTRIARRTRSGLVLVAALGALAGLLAPRALADAQAGALDDFEGAHGWKGRVESVPCGTCPFPPFLCLCPPGGQQQGASVQLGGPGGPLDSYWHVNQLPSFGLETWNQAADRTGDYNAAGIDSVELDAANLGTGGLEVRVGVERGATRWVTNDDAALLLSGGSGWLAAAFLLRETDMTRVSGSDSLATVLDGVGELRVIHATSAQWIGQAGPALGIDNVWLPEPGSGLGLACGAALLAALARRRSAP